MASRDKASHRVFQSYKKRWCTFLILPPETGEDDDEDKDDVQVQLQGAKDVLFRWQLVLPAPHQYLRVVGKELWNADRDIITKFK